jgi:hypothetical protein
MILSRRYYFIFIFIIRHFSSFQPIRRRHFRWASYMLRHDASY